MPAPKGHKKYNNAFNIKKYTPNALLEKFNEYLEWNEANPMKLIEQSKMPQRLPTNYDKKIHGNIKNFTQQTIELPIPRPLSIERFCIFAGIVSNTFINYENDETYLSVCSYIRDIINNNHFEGGMTGMYNANIVTRKLGLAEKTEAKVEDKKQINITIDGANIDLSK